MKKLLQEYVLKTKWCFAQAKMLMQSLFLFY